MGRAESRWSEEDQCWIGTETPDLTPKSFYSKNPYPKISFLPSNPKATKKTWIKHTYHEKKKNPKRKYSFTYLPYLKKNYGPLQETNNFLGLSMWNGKSKKLPVQRKKGEWDKYTVYKQMTYILCTYSPFGGISHKQHTRTHWRSDPQ